MEKKYIKREGSGWGWGEDLLDFLPMKKLASFPRLLWDQILLTCKACEIQKILRKNDSGVLLKWLFTLFGVQYREWRHTEIQHHKYTYLYLAFDSGIQESKYMADENLRSCRVCNLGGSPVASLTNWSKRLLKLITYKDEKTASTSL